MDRGRIGDVVLGVTMVLLGAAPLELVVTGRTELVAAGCGLGGFPRNLSTIFAITSTVCGLISAVAGINVVRYGGSDSTSLY